MSWVWLSRGSICSTSNWLITIGVSGYAERFGSRRQSDLGKPRRRHDGLAEHFVVSQPGAYVGSDIGLPDMVSAGRHLDVRAEERVGSGQLRHRRSIRDPESTVVPRCGWEVHQATVGCVRCGHADRGELGVKNSVWSWSRFIADVTRWLPAPSRVSVMACVSTGWGLISMKA